MQNTEVLRVKQRAIRLVDIERVISIEVPSGLRDTARIECLIRRGDLDYGPFQFRPIKGSQRVETQGLCFLGTIAGPADVPLRMEAGS